MQGKKGKKGKRTIRMTLSEDEYRSLTEASGRYGFAYPAKFVKASVRMVMERLTEAGYSCGGSAAGEDEIQSEFRDYSDWQRTSDHVFGPDVRKRR